MYPPLPGGSALLSHDKVSLPAVSQKRLGSNQLQHHMDLAVDLEQQQNEADQTSPEIRERNLPMFSQQADIISVLSGKSHGSMNVYGVMNQRKRTGYSAGKYGERKR